MITFEKSVIINRSADEVFEYLSDGESFSKWATEIVESEKTSDGPVGVGTTYKHVAQMLGRKVENHYEVTEYEVNRKISMKSTSGPVPAEFTMTVASVDGSSEFTIRAEAEVGGFFKLAEPLVARTMTRQQEANLANLKDMLEAQA
jgi:uncharacterized protein YndB with AHSA1/START domain